MASQVKRTNSKRSPQTSPKSSSPTASAISPAHKRTKSPPSKTAWDQPEKSASPRGPQRSPPPKPDSPPTPRASSSSSPRSSTSSTASTSTRAKQDARNGRYSCFCLDIGLKGSYEPIQPKGPDENPENKPEKGEFTNLQELSFENYFPIFKKCTNLTLPLWKMIVSYMFIEWEWLSTVEKVGLPVSKYTWNTGTKRERRIFIEVGLSLEDGINLHHASLYWVVPGKPYKKKRRTIFLKTLESISTGRTTPTLKKASQVDPSKCFSLNFLQNFPLPGTKVQRTFLRSLDFEMPSTTIRNQVVLFLKNFLWIYKVKD